MHKSLDLIIPVYNSHDALVKALASVAVNDIDFKLKVYIVNDGSSKGYSEEAEIFKDLLDITIFDLDVNRGVGYARKYGLEHSDGDYVAFLDADDLIYDFKSLQTLYDLIDSKNYDYAYGAIIQEAYGIGEVVEEHNGCLHGKIYRREYLNKKKQKQLRIRQKGFMIEQFFIEKLMYKVEHEKDKIIVRRDCGKMVIPIDNILFASSIPLDVIHEDFADEI